MIVAVVPARLDATRLPRKPLLKETGMPLVAHVLLVLEEARREGFVHKVVLATDSNEVRDAIMGMRPYIEDVLCVVNDEPFRNGTERCADAVEGLELGNKSHLIVNIQCDEPELHPSHVRDLVVTALSMPPCDMATLVTHLGPGDLQSEHVVKAVAAQGGSALVGEFYRGYRVDRVGWRHVGCYAWRPDVLAWLAQTAPTPNEESMRLEQMRAMDKGCRVRAALVEHPYRGIDTPEDYAAFVQRYRNARG